MTPEKPAPGTTHAARSGAGTLPSSPYADVFRRAYSFTKAQEARAAGFYPYFIPIQGSDGTEVVIEGQKRIMIGSNNYLGLTHDPRVLEAAAEAVARVRHELHRLAVPERHARPPRGAGARLAEFVGKEAAAGLLAPASRPTWAPSRRSSAGDDMVIIDSWTTLASSTAAMLSYGEMQRFRHNDMEDLERHLATAIEPNAGQADRRRRRLQHGGRHRQPARDRPDLHGSTAPGSWSTRPTASASWARAGRGTAEHFGVDDEVDLVMGTFSQVVRLDRRRHRRRCRRHRLHQAHGPGADLQRAACRPPRWPRVRKALDIIEQEPERRERLWAHHRQDARPASRPGLRHRHHRDARSCRS